MPRGNDVGGSSRYPASAAGLPGLRPSFGRVPALNPTATAGRAMSSQLLSVQGPLARTVRDIRLGLAAMAARDVRDPWWVPVPLEGPALAAPLRVAVVTEPEALGGERLHPSGAQAMRQAAGWLADACLLYTSPSPRDRTRSRMPSSACKKKIHTPEPTTAYSQS